MRCRARTLPRIVLMLRRIALVACAFVLTTAASASAAEAQAAEEPAAADEPAAKSEQAAESKPAETEPAPPELSPQMAALREGARKALATVARQPLNTRDHTPGDVIQSCLAFGVSANVELAGPSGKPINAIGCLCWNYPCAGYRLLRVSDGQVVARLGFGLQARPSQLLAVLAQSRVPDDYEIRVSGLRGTVADLVQSEKLNCRDGYDLSSTLIGLAHYVADAEDWENDLGETWSVDRLVDEELGRSADTGESDVTDRLMGLSYAVDRRVHRRRPVDGAFLRARDHVAKFQDYALGLQNPDGSWHPSFFANRGTSRDTAGTLRSTGHILEWLAFSLPEERLEDPRVVRSVAYVTRLLGDQRSRGSLASMGARDLAGVMHAAHALAIYDRRAFEPRAPGEAESEKTE